MRNPRAFALAVVLALLVTAASVSPVFVAPAPPVASSSSLLLLAPPGRWNDINPSLSPDNQRIIFSSNRSGAYDIWIMDAVDGHHMQRLTSILGNAMIPSISGDGKQIAFLWQHRSDGNNFSDLCFIPSPYSYDAVGKGVHCATAKAHVESYAWSPMGERLAYNNGTVIRFYDAASNESSPFPFNGKAREPVFGMSGTRMYFSGSAIGGGYAIWGANLDGRNLTRLSWSGFDKIPLVSPKDDNILYLTNYTGAWDPWLIDMRDGTSRSLFDTPEIVGYIFPPSPPLTHGNVPCWSSDGSRVLMVSSQNSSTGSLFVVTLNFIVRVDPVVAGGGNEFRMSVFNKLPLQLVLQQAKMSSDGKKMVLVSEESGFARLYLYQFDLTRIGSYGR